jgi:hypothetical protein
MVPSFPPWVFGVHDSKRKGDIHVDMFSPIKKRPTGVIEKNGSRIA